MAPAEPLKNAGCRACREAPRTRGGRRRDGQAVCERVLAVIMWSWNVARWKEPATEFHDGGGCCKDVSAGAVIVRFRELWKVRNSGSGGGDKCGYRRQDQEVPPLTRGRS